MMAHVVFQLCFVASFFMAKTEAFFAQPGEAVSKRRGTPPPTFLEAPQESHYFVTRKQPANLTWVATNVCKMQIKCNKEKFRDGSNRVCKQTCRGCKTRRRTKIVKVKDFPEGVKSMTCKVWGTKVIKTEKIIVEKAFLRRNFTVVQSLHVVPSNATVILPCKPPHGKPRPRITWYKNGEPFSPKRGRQVIFAAKNTVKLVIKHVSANDSGEYRCVAMNMAGRREGPILRLEVRENVSTDVFGESSWNCSGQPSAACTSESNMSSSYALLIVGTEDVLLKIDLRNTSRRTQLQVKNVMSLDFSSDENLVYWSNKKEIKQLSLQTGISEVIPFHHNDVSSVPFPEGIAVDWTSGKLYWTDAKRDAIYVGDLRNGRKVTIIEGKIDSPKAIVVSPSNGYIYWTNWGQAPHIERARLDGTERRALVYNGIKFSKGLALDELGKKLFWAGTDDNKHGIIEAVSLDGLNRSVIFYEQGYHPFCLDTFEGYVYWADWGRNAILRINSLGGEAEVIIEYLNKPMGLKILHPREPRPEGNKTCRSDEFTCNDGNCTSMRWKCNGRDDCGDSSDEINCQNRRPKCNNSQMLCKDGRQCISVTMKCDRTEDCFDASDELNCNPPVTMMSTIRPKICAKGEIRCHVANVSRCIAQRLLCDAVRNCLNGEDELAVNCPETTCRPDQFTCNNSKCIHQNRTCDGDDDCGDKSDEINCNFQIPRDEPGDVLALGSGDGLHKIDLRDRSVVTHIKSKEIVSLDFGGDPFQVYWSDRRSLNLLSLHNGAWNEMPFRRGEIMSIESLAVDRLANKLYWADAGQHAIYVGDLKNGKNVKLIENLPKAIVLSQGYMYWIDCCKGSAHIERARLDGSERKKLISGGIQFPTGLALDESAGKLYWAGINADKKGIIEAISLNGLHRTVKLHEKFYKPFSLDVFGDYVYWSDERKNEVLRINKSNGYGEEVIMRDLIKPQGLKIRREKSPVIHGIRSCDHNNGGCEYMCLNLQHPKEQACLCKEGLRLTKDGKTCEEVKGPNIAKGTEKSESNEPWIPLVFLFAVILPLLAFLLGVLVVKKQLLCSRRRAGHAHQGTGELNEDQTDRAQVIVNNANEVSSALIPQIPAVNSSRAGADTEDLQLMGQAQRDPVPIVYYNTMNVNMVNVDQTAGMTVVGDGANVTYDQRPQSFTTSL